MLRPMDRFVERLRAGEGREKGVYISWPGGPYGLVRVANGMVVVAPRTDVVYPAGLGEAA